jgi:Flp pilus assembly pilin Flp
MWHGDDRKKEQGATLVEFAFVAPFLFLMLFAIVEFALLTASFTGVWTAAREGARYATTVGDSTVTPGTPRYLDCAGIRNAAQGLVAFGEPTDGQIAINYFDPAGTQVADCNTADSTYPTPTQSACGLREHGRGEHHEELRLDRPAARQIRRRGHSRLHPESQHLPGGRRWQLSAEQPRSSSPCLRCSSY